MVRGSEIVGPYTQPFVRHNHTVHNTCEIIDCYLCEATWNSWLLAWVEFEQCSLICAGVCCSFSAKWMEAEIWWILRGKGKIGWTVVIPSNCLISILRKGKSRNIFRVFFSNESNWLNTKSVVLIPLVCAIDAEAVKLNCHRTSSVNFWSEATFKVLLQIDTSVSLSTHRTTILFVYY